MTTLLAFVFVLGVLVFVHELGHFMAARWNGVRVLTFSLGFGPKLLSFRRGDTEYCVSAIPLGGYVKMAGENPDDPRSGQPDEFLSKTKWQRFQILIMGPAMNLALAVVVLAVVLMQGATSPAYLDDPALVGVVQEGSPAERAGVQPGDIITRVGSAAVSTWEQLELAVASRPEREVEMIVIRDSRERRLTIRPDTAELRTRSDARFEVGTIGVMPDASPVIRSVLAGEPAEQAGFKAGDAVVSIAGQRIVFASQVSQEVEKHPDEAVEVVLRRDGKELVLAVTPSR
ncbi:MAG: RIP metalloprotease RseP, partial [Acidobacteriota bacterium]|nr:RIP metalloprotease RseP [Acidobacteriota bacterium]